MKKHLQICFSILLLSFIFSCNGQQKTKEVKTAVPQSKQAETDLPETDPYFTESDTITSYYGPNSITRNIIQDKKGNFWFATWQGIIQYDGNTFTNFTNKEGLKRFHVFAVFEDTTGNIWFGTIGAGVYRYDGKLFTHFSTEDGLANNQIGCFLEDKKGNIWIGTADGISKYNGKSFTNFAKKEGLTNTDVNSIIEDKTGKLWIGTRGNASYYDGQQFKEITNAEGQNFVNVRTIIEDKQGTVWLGGNDGLWSYDGNAFINFTDNFVGYIYQDKQENIWTSALDKGNSQKWTLSKYDYNSLKDKKANPVHIKTEENMFFGITEDNQNRIWLGTLNGVYRYDGMLFTDFTK